MHREESGFCLKTNCPTYLLSLQLQLLISLIAQRQREIRNEARSSNRMFRKQQDLKLFCYICRNTIRCAVFASFCPYGSPYPAGAVSFTLGSEIYLPHSSYRQQPAVQIIFITSKRIPYYHMHINFRM